MRAVTNYKLRNNHIVRFCLLPFMRVKRQLQYIDYHKRVNTDYFKSIKGTKMGERCFIIGNGPSLTIEDLDLLKGEFNFGFNRIYDIYEKTSWRPTYYMVVDKSFIQSLCNVPAIDLGSNKVFIYDKKLSEHWKSKNDVQEIFCHGERPIVREKYYQKTISENVEDYFTASQSVTCSAFELAFYMGFSEIYLLGIDHEYQIEITMNGKKIINKNINSYFKECKGNDSNKSISCIEAMTKCFETCKEYADSHNIKVYNCTRGGKLEVFERKNLEDVL